MLDYKKLMDQKPTVYDTVTNKQGQEIDLVEHPTKGDMYPVIAVCHELKLAEVTEFFDTEDMTNESGDYRPVFVMDKGYRLLNQFEVN